MEVDLVSVGLFAPGLPGWEASQPVLRGGAPYSEAALPPFVPALLPPNENRRATFTIRLALQAAQEAMTGAAVDPAVLASVFACSSGDAEALERIFAALLTAGKPVSPTHFNHSIHNSPAGYWSIATRSHEPSISIAAYDATFAAGLLEAGALVSTARQEVLLVAYDVAPPPPLYAFRPLVAPFAVALVLKPAGSPHGLGRLRLALTAEGTEDRLTDPALERLRTGNPAARCLPLLRLIALNPNGRVVLPYISPSYLSVNLEPC